MAAQCAKSNLVAADVRAMVVPGSMQVRRQLEEKGLADIFREAGFQWARPAAACVSR